MINVWTQLVKILKTGLEKWNKNWPTRAQIFDRFRVELAGNILRVDYDELSHLSSTRC